MFEKVSMAPADPILGLTEKFKADNRAEKINLGVGVYKNEDGATPILPTVKKAEAIILEQESTKSYLSIPGTPEYGEVVRRLLFGFDSHITRDNRAQTAQAPGGTGALRVAAEFAVQELGASTIWVSNPTWANHHGVFREAGLDVSEYAYYDWNEMDMNFSAMLADLENAKAGDLVLFHGCCHNPTGVDPTIDEWEQLACLCKQKGLLPLFDFAYQGFATGINEDAKGLRFFAAELDELLIASSFSKNFGLYNERVGAFTLVAKEAEIANTAFSQVKRIIRTIYSNPPTHGAAIVTEILNTPSLTTEWENEVAEMRDRIKEMRHLFVQTLKDMNVDRDFNFIIDQNGMFSFSGLTKDQVARLQNEFGVYIVGSGRISVAGMTKNNIPALCEAIAAVL